MNTTLHLQNLIAFALGLALTWLLLPSVIRQAISRGVLDQPDDGRHIHQKAVPRLGGVGVVIGTAIAAAVVMAVTYFSSWFQFQIHYPSLMPAMLIGAALVFVTGLFDDLRGVSPRAKLLLQTLAALIVVGAGFRVDTIALTGVGAGVHLGMLAAPVTVLWIVGVTNAFNLIDGIDGLAGSMALIALTTAIGVGFYLHGPRSTVISLALLGAVFGFLHFNNHPARIFLGDSGSMTLGFFLAIRTVIAATDNSGRTFVMVPLFALAYPLLDTTVAIARRWLRGHPFSRADGRHIHHQFLSLGLSTRSTVDILGCAFMAVAAAGLAISFAPRRLTAAFVLATLLLGSALTVYGVQWLRYSEFAEVARSVASVLRNARRVVREKILAGEVVEQIANARSLAEIQELLDRLDDELNLQDIRLIPRAGQLASPLRQQIAQASRESVRLDYPVIWESSDGTQQMTLSFRVPRQSASEYLGTERIAARIGPAIEQWCSARRYSLSTSDALAQVGPLLGLENQEARASRTG